MAIAACHSSELGCCGGGHAYTRVIGCCCYNAGKDEYVRHSRPIGKAGLLSAGMGYSFPVTITVAPLDTYAFVSLIQPKL